MADKEDNGDFEAKDLVRAQALEWAPPKPKVLDCYAGEGHMYRRTWKAAAGEYLGIDKRFARPRGDSSGECWRGDNERIIARAMARAPWELVDLDAYANPWPLLRKVLKLARPDVLIATVTCGIDRAIQSGSSDFAAAVAGASRLSYLGIMTRWYDDVIRWALAWCTGGTRYRVQNVKRISGAHNYRMRYWALRLGVENGRKTQ